MKKVNHQTKIEHMYYQGHLILAKGCITFWSKSSNVKKKEKQKRDI